MRPVPCPELRLFVEIVLLEKLDCLIRLCSCAAVRAPQETNLRKVDTAAGAAATPSSDLRYFQTYNNIPKHQADNMPKGHRRLLRFRGFSRLARCTVPSTPSDSGRRGGCRESVSSVIWSRDGSTAAVLTEDSIRVVEGNKLQTITQIPAPKTNAVAFSHSGELLLTHQRPFRIQDTPGKNLTVGFSRSRHSWLCSQLATVATFWGKLRTACFSKHASDMQALVKTVMCSARRVLLETCIISMPYLAPASIMQ